MINNTINGDKYLFVMGDEAAQYEADLAKAMALSLETHALETQRRRDSGQQHIAIPQPITGQCKEYVHLVLGIFL